MPSLRKINFFKAHSRLGIPNIPWGEKERVMGAITIQLGMVKVLTVNGENNLELITEVAVICLSFIFSPLGSRSFCLLREVFYENNFVEKLR